jgi:hypothetical protein
MVSDEFPFYCKAKCVILKIKKSCPSGPVSKDKFTLRG